MLNPWDKVQTITGNIWYISSRTHFVGYVTYSVWDWCDKYHSMDEWMLTPYIEKKVGFSESITESTSWITPWTL